MDDVMQLEQLDFSIHSRNYTHLTMHQNQQYKGFTKIINMARGIRVIHRELSCCEETHVDYSKNLPSNTAVGAFSLSSTSASDLYDIRTRLIHKPGTGYWGNVPNENCASLLPERKRASMVYVCTDQKIFSAFGEEDRSQGGRLWETISGASRGVCNTGIIPKTMSTCLGQIISSLPKSPFDWLRCEALGLEALASALEDEGSLKPKREQEGIASSELGQLHYAREILMMEMENPPSLLELAQKCGLNEFKLKKGFKQLFGVPVFEYLRRERIRTAARLIESGSCSITEAALEVGYKSPGAFSTAFRHYTGRSPREYRRKQIWTSPMN